MSASTSFLVITIILMVVQRSAFGLNCYNCGIGTDGCGPSFNSKGSGIMQVSGSSVAYCAKTVYASNTNSIARAGITSSVCTGATTVTVTASTTSAGSDGMTIYCCATDLCNGSMMKSASVLLAMAAVTLSFFLKK